MLGCLLDPTNAGRFASRTLVPPSPSTALVWHACSRRNSDWRACPHRRGFDAGCCLKVATT
jgi:hypothetical protein